MGKRDFPRMRPIAATHQTGMADGMVGSAERTIAQQWSFGWELVGNGIDAGDIQCLIDGHFWQDARQRPCQEGLSCPRRSDHNNV